MSIPKNSSERILQNTPLIDQIIPDIISNYKFDDKLGEGRFGKVRLAIHKLTKEKVAIKIIDKNQIKLKEHRQRVDSEISILKQVNHYNTCKLYSIIENEERIYLIQEYISGNDLSLFIKQKDKPHIKEKNACKYFRQIISGIEYLHKLNIAHRDLKPENILINQKNDIKLIDFGLGKIFNKGELLKGLQSKIKSDTLEQDVEQIFKNIDMDNNGYIEYEEFVRAAVSKERFINENVLRFAFRYFDKDGSGEITFDEIEDVFKQSVTDKAKVHESLKKIISEVDTNGDGIISFTEFSDIMKKMLKK